MTGVLITKPVPISVDAPGTGGQFLLTADPNEI